jgi:hypothetical protein
MSAGCRLKDYSASRRFFRHRLRPVPFISVCLAVKPVGEPDA